MSDETEKQLHVWTIDEADKVIAYDADDALAVWAETIGEPYAVHCDDDDYPGPTLWPDDEPLTIVDVDEPSKPGETMTGTQWAAKVGRSFLSTTEY